MTKIQLLAELTADFTAVTATIVGPMTTLTEWPALEACLIEDGWVKRKDVPGYEYPGTPHYINIPSLHRVRTGNLLAQKKGGMYVFTWGDGKGKYHTSAGLIADLKVNGTALALTMHNGCKIRYTKG